ncbi:MAG: hypothetical protein AAFQ37_05360, partial [Bacteroidota bacterium]
MSKSTEQGADFYIGWREKLPTPHRKAARQFVYGAVGVFTLVAVLLVLNQRGFANSVFELGNITSVEGILLQKPVPMLQTVENGQKKSILLVGFGKAGAEETLTAIQGDEEVSIYGAAVELKGTLIYYQDKTVLELTEGVESFVGFRSSPNLRQMATVPTDKKDFGQVSLFGEILDPKCALGVMKPGHGKPHRSCAIRCISGGISPIFRMRTTDNKTNYALVVGEDGSKINAPLLPYVADQLRLCG